LLQQHAAGRVNVGHNTHVWIFRRAWDTAILVQFVQTGGRVTVASVSATPATRPRHALAENPMKDAHLIKREALFALVGHLPT